MRGIQNIEKLIESGALDVLWENQNPTSEFTPQTLVVPNADKYDLLFWVFRTDITNQGTWLDTEIVEPNSFVYPNAVFPSGDNTYSYARPIRLIANNQYRVDSGYKDATTSNGIMVPLKVCGIHLGGLNAQGWRLEGIVFGPGAYNALAKQLYDKVSWSLDKDYKLIISDFTTVTSVCSLGEVRLTGSKLGTDFICQGYVEDAKMHLAALTISTDINICKLRSYTFTPDATSPVSQVNYDTHNYPADIALMIYSRDLAGSADPAVTITDDIEVGNMYPVTSNAVADKIEFIKRITASAVSISADSYTTICDFSEFTGKYIGILFAYGTARVPFDFHKSLFATASGTTTRFYVVINQQCNGGLWLKRSDDGKLQAQFQNAGTATSGFAVLAYTHN